MIHIFVRGSILQKLVQKLLDIKIFSAQKKFTTWLIVPQFIAYVANIETDKTHWTCELVTVGDIDQNDAVVKAWYISMLLYVTLWITGGYACVFIAFAVWFATCLLPLLMKREQLVKQL